jgi:hypothetical protein
MPGHSEIPKGQHANTFEGRALKVSDELRKVDDLPQMERILRVLFSETYDSAANRYDALTGIIDELGEECHPGFCRVMRQVAEENLHLSARSFKARMAELEQKTEDVIRQRTHKDANEEADEV